MSYEGYTIKYTRPTPARNSWTNGQNATTLYSKTLSQQTLLRKFSIWVEIQTKHLLTEVRAYHFRQPTWYQWNASSSSSVHDSNYLKQKIIFSHKGKQHEVVPMLIKHHIITQYYVVNWSQWPHGLRHKSAETVGSSPTGGMEVCCECCVLSSSGLCNDLITHSRKSYQLWCIAVSSIDLENYEAMARIWPQ